MERIPKSNEIYQHFKGNLYRVITLAKHTETGEDMVVYQALYGDFGVYVRPLAMFVSPVDQEKYPDVKAKYRFTLVPQVMDGSGLTAGAGQPPEAAGQKPAQETASEAGEHSREQEAASEATGRRPASEAQTGTEAEACPLDPKLLAFLDADSYEEKLQRLVAMQSNFTEEMAVTVAVSLDLETPEGSLEEQFAALKNSLLMLEKYECSRLR